MSAVPEGQGSPEVVAPPGDTVAETLRNAFRDWVARLRSGDTIFGYTHTIVGDLQP